MVVSLIQINCLIRYHTNCKRLSLFGIRNPLYFHVKKIIQYQHLLEPILKPQQNLFFPETDYNTAVNYLQMFLENYSFNYYSNSHTFAFTTFPTWILLTLPLNLLCGGLGYTEYNNKQQVTSWLVEWTLGAIISGI